MVFINNKRHFTLKLCGENPSLIEMDMNTVLQLCKEMHILRQIWFGFKATEKDIINKDKRILTLHKDYKITRNDFIDVIRILKYKEASISEKKINKIQNTIITLGGCDKIENILKIHKNKNMHKKINNEKINKEYSQKVKTPDDDYKDCYLWKTVLRNNVRLLIQETIHKVEEEGYKLTHFNNVVYHFRKAKRDYF